MQGTPISRRTFLKLSGLAALASSTGAVSLFGEADAAAAASPTGFTWLVGQTGTTLDRTITKKAPDLATNYISLESGAGEGYTVRTDLGPATFDVGYAITAFAQMTDLHVVDDQSPARVEFLDRLTDGSHDYASAYRPHEFMSTHVVDAMTRALRKMRTAPRTGLPLALTIVTGDAVDNCQYNETRWYIDLLDGNRSITADSGDPRKDESVSGEFGHTGHDPAYWAPGASPGFDDDYHRNFGYGRYPGLMGDVREPYTSTGLDMPWYAAFGNHDVAVQGNLPIDAGGLGGCILPNFSDVATDIFKSWTSTYTMPPDAQAGALDVGRLYDNLQNLTITADQTRRMLNHDDFMREHLTTTGVPVGHGFGSESGSLRSYYTIDDDPLITFIVLDTANPAGHSGGRIDGDQWRWLKDRLKERSRFYYDDGGDPTTNDEAQDKLIVVACHHTLDSIDNNLGEPGTIGNIPPFNAFHFGLELRQLLLRHPNVILMVDGHTHRNGITAHHRSDNIPGTEGGFWEVNTASHIDWPAQSRIFEIAVSPLHIAIYTTIVDIDADPQFNGDQRNQKALAALARELAANDPTERPLTRAGDPEDRNAELWLPAPFPLLNLIKTGSGPVVYADADGVLHIGAFPVGDGSLRVRPGTSPSVAVDTDGFWTVAYQSISGQLSTVDRDNNASTTGLTMAAGSSPAITRSLGGLVTAYQDDRQLLRVVGTEFGVYMAADTNPSIASPTIMPIPIDDSHDPIPPQYLIAFAHPAADPRYANLYTMNEQGALEIFGGQLYLAPGTSPAIAAWPTGGYLIAFHNLFDGNLCTVTDTGVVKNTNIPMYPGASPTIAASMQGWCIAYQGSDGSLYFISSGGGVPTRVEAPLGPDGTNVAAGTTPFISPATFERTCRIWWKHPDNTQWFFDGTSPQSLTYTMLSSPGGAFNPGRGASALAIAPPTGPGQIIVPNVVSVFERDAIAAMQATGLLIGDISLRADAGATGYVISQSPAPGPQPFLPNVSTFDLVIAG